MISVFVAIGILTGCTSIDVQKNLPESETENHSETDTANEQTESLAVEAAEQSTNEGDVDLSKQAGRELSSKELQDFTDLINQIENNGFLLSEYAVPADVNLEEVLYNGAGINSVPMTEREMSAYLKAAGSSEITTDCIKLTTQQINDFLNRKMGISFWDISEEFSWVYLPEFDEFINEHGDTNFAAFTCVSGIQVGEDTYILNCAANDEFASACELELRKVGDTYQFVSNHFNDDIQNAKDIWVIADQTFQVNLDDWGDVTFTSYAPDTSVSMFTDVTFALVKDGETVFKFPGMEENNIRGACIFERIKAIGFKDYDGDGRKDVIIINQYVPGAGKDIEQVFDEVRVYRYKADKQEFILDIDACDFLNVNHITNSIAEVVEQLPISKNEDIEADKITVEEACQKITNTYFSTNDMYETAYDEDGKLSVVLSRWEHPWAEEKVNRPGETLLFYDSETDNEYVFGCYKVYYEQDRKTVFATQTVGWYHVNFNTGELSN